MVTCQLHDPSEYTQNYQLILIKFDTCMYRINRRISFKPFLPTCFRYQIHSGIKHGHDLGTTKNRWIRKKSGNLKTFCVYLSIFFFNIGLMVGFKAKTRASAYLTKLGLNTWVGFCGCVCGGVCVGGVCVCVWGGCMCVCVRGGYSWGGWGCVRRWECIGRRGKRNHTIIS